jgi:hypothetical protein
VIGSLIGHSARGGSTTTTEKFRQRLPRSGALSPRIASGRGRTQGGGGSRLAFGPMPTSPGGACDGSEAAACPGLRSPEAFAAAPPHCAACRRPNRT